MLPAQRRVPDPNRSVIARGDEYHLLPDLTETDPAHHVVVTTQHLEWASSQGCHRRARVRGLRAPRVGGPPLFLPAAVQQQCRTAHSDRSAAEGEEKPAAWERPSRLRTEITCAGLHHRLA